jgi:hypothetical protein
MAHRLQLDQAIMAQVRPPAPNSLKSPATTSGSPGRTSRAM